MKLCNAFSHQNKIKLKINNKGKFGNPQISKTKLTSQVNQRKIMQVELEENMILLNVINENENNIIFYKFSMK